MKNVTLINALDFEIKKSCNPFSNIKEADVLKSKITFIENNISEKLNSLSSNRLKLAYQKKYKYDVIGKEGENIGSSEFGAYFFQPSDVSPQYKVCLGPVIELPVENRIGINMPKGCNTSDKRQEERQEDEKEKGCNSSSSDGKKSAGCNPSITGGQYLNFQNNDRNSEYVKSINKSKGWRLKFNKLVNDFPFTSYFSWSQTDLSISISEYYDMIIDAANTYIENLAKDNLNYECQLTLPATNDGGETKVLENAVLCSSTSKQSFYIERSSFKEAYLSAFDLMYVSSDDWFKKLSKIPKIGGYFESIKSFILLIKKLFGNKPKVTDINNENLESLQDLYSTEFSEQIANIETIERLKANKIGSINVFVLVPLWSSSFGLKWRKFFKRELHKRITFEVDLTKKENGNNNLDFTDSPNLNPLNVVDFDKATVPSIPIANEVKTSIEPEQKKQDNKVDFEEAAIPTIALANEKKSNIELEKQKQGKSNKVVVILGIIAFIVIAGGAIYYTQFLSKNIENTSNASPITEETKDIANTIIEENTSEISNSIDLTGEWKGAFGNDQLLINIESINEDGNVSGFNMVKNNRRALTGFKNGNNFELKEPGDDKWDGVFKFTISNNEAIGIWKSNNGKLTKQFSLTKSGNDTEDNAPSEEELMNQEAIDAENNLSIDVKYPQTSERLLSASDFTNLSKAEIKIMRNEIFARHGYIFKTADMKSYFENQPWYTAKYDNVTSMLSGIEKQNLEIIKMYE